MVDNNQKLATFGGGCFWCVEAVVQRLIGVNSVKSGYSGGQTKNPTYEEICTGTTGHAEAIQISFDEKQISFYDLLYVFMKMHDPTTLNRQGADQGTQYRSVIFYHDDSQKTDAGKIFEEFTNAKVYNEKIVTELTPFEIFYDAETKHQNYYNQNTTQGYCQAAIDPKIKKLYKTFQQKIKEEYFKIDKQN